MSKDCKDTFRHSHSHIYLFIYLFIYDEIVQEYTEEYKEKLKKQRIGLRHMHNDSIIRSMFAAPKIHCV